MKSVEHTTVFAQFVSRLEEPTGEAVGCGHSGPRKGWRESRLEVPDTDPRHPDFCGEVAAEVEEHLEDADSFAPSGRKRRLRPRLQPPGSARPKGKAKLGPAEPRPAVLPSQAPIRTKFDPAELGEKAPDPSSLKYQRARRDVVSHVRNWVLVEGQEDGFQSRGDFEQCQEVRWARYTGKYKKIAGSTLINDLKKLMGSVRSRPEYGSISRIGF